jgi:hypothetical protein
MRRRWKTVIPISMFLQDLLVASKCEDSGIDSDWLRLSFLVDEVGPGQNIPPSLFRSSPTSHHSTIAPFNPDHAAQYHILPP